MLRSTPSPSETTLPCSNDEKLMSCFQRSVMRKLFFVVVVGLFVGWGGGVGGGACA